MDSKNIKPYLMMSVGYLIWSLDFSVYRYLFPTYISPFTMASIVLVFSGFVMFLTGYSRRAERIDRRDLYKFIVGGVFIGLFKKGLLMLGMSDTTPIDASIISTTGPVMVLIFAVLFHADRITWQKLLGIALGIVGTLMIIFNNEDKTAAPHRMLGNLIVLLSQVSIAFYMVWLRTLIHKYRPITLLRGMYVSAGCCALPLLIYSLPHISTANFTPVTWWLAAYVLLLPTLIPNFLIIASLRYLKATVVSVYSYIMPIFAILISLLVGQDRLTWVKVVAAAIVFVGVYLVIRSYKNTSQSIAPHHPVN